MMVMFIEYNGFYVDTQLITECAGYVRDALVYASAAQPDFYPLTKFLNDAISRVPFDVAKESVPEKHRELQLTVFLVTTAFFDCAFLRSSEFFRK